MSAGTAAIANYMSLGEGMASAESEGHDRQELDEPDSGTTGGSVSSGDDGEEEEEMEDLVNCRWLSIKQVCYGMFAIVAMDVLALLHYLAKSDSVSIYAIALLILFALFPWEGHTLSAPLPERTAPPTGRLYYLDNLKVCLTQLVMMHHSLIGYGGVGKVDGFVIGRAVGSFRYFAISILGIDQSYFMALFFFISAYFSPSSLEKKGAPEFVRDKLKRYGLPLLAFHFLLAWLGQLFVDRVIFDTTTPYVAKDGPTWFLEVLIIFNLIYAVFPSPRVYWPLPPLWSMCLVGYLLGAVQGLFVFTGMDLAPIPLTFSSAPFYMAFFAAGIVARRSDWLNSIGCLSCSQLIFLTLVNIVCVVALVLSIDPGMELECEKPGQQQQDVGRGANELFKELAAGSLFGVMAVSISVSLLGFFARFMNFTGPVWRFLSEGAYAFYVLHAVVWPVASWTYVLILKMQGVHLYFEHCGGILVSRDPEDELVKLLGWLYTVLTTSAVLWPTSYFLKQLPGFREVL